MLKQVGIAALSLLLGITISLPQAYAAPIEIKIASGSNEGMPYHIAFNEMVEFINTSSNGKYHATVYPQYKLGNTSTVVQGLQTSMIHFVHDSTSNLSTFTKVLGLFDYPYIFYNENQVMHIFNSTFTDSLLKKFNSRTLTYLGVADNSFRNILTTKPVRRLADVQSMKIRCTQSKIHIAALKSLGIAATPMPFSEVYTGLQQGVVDGLDLDYSYAASMRLYEVTPYVFESHHLYSPQLIVTGTRWWNRLSDEDRALFTKAVQLWQKRCSELVAAETLRCKKICEDAGNTIVTPDEEELKVWQKAAKTSLTTMSDAQKALYNDIQKELSAAGLL